LNEAALSVAAIKNNEGLLCAADAAVETEIQQLTLQLLQNAPSVTSPLGSTVASRKRHKVSINSLHVARCNLVQDENDVFSYQPGDGSALHTPDLRDEEQVINDRWEALAALASVLADVQELSLRDADSLSVS